MLEHADSRWSIESRIEGRWGSTPVVIKGSDAGRWSELSPILDVAGGSRTEISFSLDAGRAVIARDLDTERLCGAGSDPRDFFTGSIEEGHDALTELGWSDPDSPVLHYAASGCEGPLRTSLDLSGEDRLGRATDLQAVITSLPDDHVIEGVTVEDSGDLRIALEGRAPDALATDLAESWSHGEVWINDTRATAR